ncbi:MAG: hypothetical protein V4654_01670 [Bdellovibrionota bacterium]
MNMKKAISAFLSTALLVSTATAGPIVNKLGKNAFNTQINAGIEKVLGKHTQSAMLNPSVAFYETYPAKNMLSLNDVSFVPRSDDSNSVVLTDYVAMGAQSANGSALGLRMALAPQESRLEAARSMAESGLIKTGDIIISTRPLFANSLQYLALQLLNTHISVAVVITEGGRKVVYNVDMPMDADMLGGKAVGFGKSAMDSSHFTADNENLMLQILRPRLSETQKKNLQAWFEKALEKARSKTMYPSSLSFNSDYNSPTYRGNGDLSFVADTARLLLGQKMKEHDHMQMFCSEFAWVMLSLRDCNPDGSNLKSCVSEYFKPMQMLGTAFSGGSASDQDLYGMTDGIPMLIQQTGASSQLAMGLIDFALPGVEKEAKGLSSGHKGVASAMAPLIQQMNGYFKLTLSQNAQQINGARAQLNPSSPRNYSPTGFGVHAAMPNQINGKTVTQKKFDYVVTIKYVPKAQLKDLQSK